MAGIHGKFQNFSEYMGKTGSIHGFFRSSMWYYDLAQALQKADEIRVERVAFI